MTPSADSIGLIGSIRLLLRYLAPNRRAFYAVVLLSLLDTGLSAQISLSFKYLIDGAIGQRSGRILALIAISLSLSILLVGAAGIWRDKLYGRAAGELSASMRLKMFEHMQRLSAGFYSRMQAADIVSRFSNDLAEVESAFLSAVPYAVLPALDIAMSIVLIFLLDWRLALPAVAAFPLAMAGPRWLSSKTSIAAYERKQHEAQIVANVQENVSAHALVRAFNLEKFARTYFFSHNLALQRIVARLGFLTLLMERSASFSTQLLQVAVLGIGGYLTFRGEMSIGTLAAFQALFATLAESLGYIAEYLPEIVRASGGMIRIEELLAEQPQVSDAEDAVVLPAFSNAIEFRDVAFGYEADQRNLDGLTLRIPRGTSVALVGPSGSGKSTVLTLLMRFYDPAEGAVTIDGHNLRAATQESLRMKTSMVFQENYLFNAAIRENIRMARPDASDEEVEQACRQAGIHDFISELPDGYNTVVGATDGRFPAGHRQRVAIARALLRKPEILMLDEATSALDSGSEARINQTISEAAAGRTVISVTHRLSSVINADRIYLVVKGKVIEEGTHAELLEREGEYSRIWKKQSGFVLSADGEQVRATPEWLRRVPVLSQLDESLLAELSRMFVTEHCSRGRFLFHEGEAGDRFYILVRGIVEVVRSRPEGLQRLAVLQDGDHFGETSLILNAPRNASVRALGECTLLSLSRDRFLSLMQAAPSLRWKLREQASIAAFQREMETSEAPETSLAGTTTGLRHDLLNFINQIAGYSEMLAEDLDDAGEPDLAAVATTIRDAAASVQAGIERALPSRESLTADRLAALRDQTGTSLRELQNAASGLKAATAGEKFANLQPDLDKIRAESERLRTMIAESRFDLSGPATEEAKPAGAARPFGHGWHLLVVDDNDSGRSLLCRKLERDGFRTSAAATGTEALEKIASVEYDLVLLDVMMPDLDGYQVLERMKASGSLGRVPVVMTTAMDEVEDVARCLDLGAEDYLTKPFDGRLLRARLTAVLTRKRARDHERARLAELEERCRLLESAGEGRDGKDGQAEEASAS